MLVVIFIYSFYAVSSYIKDNKNKDPGEIIIDELIGQSIPIFAYKRFKESANKPKFPPVKYEVPPHH